MAATLKSLSSKKATIYVPVDTDNPDGEKVRIVYRTKALNESRLNRIIDSAGGPENKLSDLRFGAVASEMFLAYVVEWDLRANEEDSDPIALTRDGIADVPTDFLQSIVAAIQADQRPDPTTDKS